LGRGALLRESVVRKADNRERAQFERPTTKVKK
jgi:hypothetical protein